MPTEDTQTLSSPSLVAPRDATVVNGREVTFVWKPVAGADTYRLQVAPTTRFEAPVLDAEVGDETAVTVGNQLPTDGETFFWRVLAGADGEWSAGKDMESFVVGTEEDAEQDLTRRADADAGPVTELARAARSDAPQTVFELEDRFEKEKERGVAYEGVAAGQILGIAAAIIAVILVAVLVILGWFGQVRQDMQAEAANLQDYQELRQAEAEQSERLQGYGVVDEEAGIYHIPIDRAMDLIATEDDQQPQE